MISQLEKEVVFRFLRTRKKDGFLNIITIFSFIGISLGVAVLIIVSSLFAVIYIWKIVEVLYFSESSKSYSEVSVLTLTPIWILSLFCIFLGINTGLTVDVANMAALILFK